MRHFAAISCLLLAGCGHLHQLKLLDPEANDFASALASEYLDYAESQAEQGHSASAEYFAKKGMKALENEDVIPELPSKKIPEPLRQELATSREMLLSLLSEDVKGVAAQKAARAQLLFDCWQDQGSKEETRTLCKEEFQSVTDELQTVAQTLGYGKDIVRVVYFADKKTMLDDSASDMIADTAAHVLNFPRYKVALEGYTGSTSASRSLAQRRLDVVRDALIASGIPEQRVEIITRDMSKTVYLGRDEEWKEEKNSVKIEVWVPIREGEGA